MSTDKTPVQVLEEEIAFLKRFRIGIETKEGLYINPLKKEEIEANLFRKHAELGEQIKVFEAAINAIATVQQSRNKSIAFAEWIAESGNDMPRPLYEWENKDDFDRKGKYTATELYDLYIDHLTKTKNK